LFLGQTHPENEPKVFKLEVTPGSFAAERLTISNDGSEIYYSDTYIYWVNIENMIESMKHTNLPPYAKNKPNVQRATKGELFTYSMPNNAVCDDDGQTIIYEALLIDGSPLPYWLGFDTKTKTLTGTPTETGNIVLRINAMMIKTKWQHSDLLFLLPINS